jgi:hypothetical protein
MHDGNAFMALVHRHKGKLTAAELQTYVDRHPTTRVCVYLIGLLASLLQILFIILLCNAHGGMHEVNTHRFHYISDKLASDHVIGYLLVFVFSISLLLLSVCIQDMCHNRPLYWITAWLLATTAAMGVGVVGFNEHESDISFYGHVVCAGCFITGAIVVHVIILMTNTIKWSAQKTCWMLIILAVACAVVFVVFFFWSFLLPHDTWRNEVATIAASFEFVLLIMVLTLNLLTPFRVLEHMAHHSLEGGCS